jgi:hypothetical protein
MSGRGRFAGLRTYLARFRSNPQAAGVLVVLCGFLPGALAGTQIGGLLFFLNPELPFSRWTILRTVAVYALLVGSATALLHLPFTHSSARRAARLLPWGLSFALILAAVLAGGHASHLAYYLPPGINVRLLKATISLSVAGLIAFYTALLHTVQNRRYGRRSRVGFVVLCLFSVYVMVERREAFQPPLERFRASSYVDNPERPRMLVVAVEGATLDVVLPLAEEGRLPFLASILRDGASGRLEGFTPYRRSALWTSLATGKHPYRHNIVGEEVFPAPFLGSGTELRLLPAGLGFRYWGTFGAVPREVQRTDAGALAIWQIMARLGVRSAVVGWPRTDPVPQETDFFLAESFFVAPGLPSGGHPPEVAERARLFRLDPEDVDSVVAARFGETPPREVMGALAQDGWRQSLSVFLGEERQAKALFLALPGVGRVSELYFGGFADAQGTEEPGAEQRAAAEFLAAYYGELDAFLRQWWEGQQEPTVLAIVSPNGARRLSFWDRWQRPFVEHPPLGGTYEESPDGVFLLYGPGVRPGARLTGAKIVDVVPTLLYALGFPMARDFDGRILTAAFETEYLRERALTFVPSYEPLPASGLR